VFGLMAEEAFSYGLHAQNYNCNPLELFVRRFCRYSSVLLFCNGLEFRGTNSTRKLPAFEPVISPFKHPLLGLHCDPRSSRAQLSLYCPWRCTAMLRRDIFPFPRIWVSYWRRDLPENIREKYRWLRGLLLSINPSP
jgi:hypothetical protein